MAKGIYVGVDGIARKVKKAYVGAANNSLVVNGDFESGIDRWNGWHEVYVSFTQESNGYSGKCAKFAVTTPIDSWTQARYPIEMVEGHIYYAQVYVKGLSSNYSSMQPCIALYNNYVYIATGNYVVSNITEWQKSSVYGTATTTGESGIHLRVLMGKSDESITAGMCVYYDNVRAYDLTAMYGAGNEPTKEWCDSNETALENLYKSQNSKACKVKKGYIGVGGVARPFFAVEKKIEYYGKASDMRSSRQSLAATTVGDYALFGGGVYNTQMDAYSSALVRSAPPNMSFAAHHLAATAVGDYALFGGGSSNSTYNSKVDAYNLSLAKSTLTSLSEARCYLAATTVGNYALFAGGTGSLASYDTTDTYASTLVKGTATALGVRRQNIVATTVGNYALFGGGYTQQSNVSYMRATVDTYTSSLVKGTATSLSVARYGHAATMVGDYALFAGGYNKSNYLATVDTYTSSLVKGTATDLSSARSDLAATTVGDYALFGGGESSSGHVANVDTYTSALVKSTATDLSEKKYKLRATTVGDYALFAGGVYGASTFYDTVDVYQLVES